MYPTICKFCSFEFYRKTTRTEKVCTACNRSRKRAWNIKSKYGIEIAHYDKLYKKQKGKCAICQTKYPVLHVDHDHDTKAVRGLLCSNCNTSLGLLKENVSTFCNAIVYLVEHRES